MTEEAQVHIEIPEQGISETLTYEDTIKFIDLELAFYSDFAKTLDETTIFNRALGQSGIHSNATAALRNIKSELQKKDQTELSTYIRDARNLDVLVGQGKIGTRAEDLIKKNDPEGKHLIFLTSKKWMRTNTQEDFAPLRAAAFGNPALFGFSDVSTAANALRSADIALNKAKDTQNNTNEFLEERKRLFKALEDAVRQNNVFQGPANLWKKAHEAKTWAWRLWLAIFALFATLPLFLALRFSEAMISFVTKITDSNTGAISISGLAAITIPTLFYAWFLKNISRLFITAHTLADDSAHRGALAQTYLGLIANENLNIGEQERALIMNALFRPLPSGTSDEGPPSGLLDLIKQRS